MRPGDRSRRRLGAALAAAGLVLVGVETRTLLGDEPRGLGRLFRFGGPPAMPTASHPPTSRQPTPPAPSFPPPLLGTPTAASTPPTPANPTGRIVPQPRVNRPATESDPLLTRISLGRTDDGKTFGDFLQVYADGTIIDGMGVHRVGHDALRPLVQAIQATDAARVRGHCGGPATDFVEGVYVVVYDRSLGRLRANAFSYSGNPQGCDASIRQLQAAIETIQTRISPPPTAAPADTAPAPSSTPPPSSTAAPIPLTTP